MGAPAAAENFKQSYPKSSLAYHTDKTKATHRLLLGLVTQPTLRGSMGRCF